MNEYRVIIRYRQYKYFSEYKEFTHPKLESLKTQIERINKGDLNTFSMGDKSDVYYFNKYILERSIITIQKK